MADKTNGTKKKGLQKLKNFALDVLFMSAGAALYSVAVNMFTSPNQIAPGGVTGLSIIIEHLTGMPIGLMMFLLNIPLLLLGYKFLGRQFITKTLTATVILSVVVDLLKPFLPIYQGDKFLAAVFSGVLSGGGLVCILLRGATSGGSDILARLLQLKWPYLSFGRMILAVDLVVVAVSGIVFHSLESVLYAVILIFVSSKVIDTVLYGTGNGKLMYIITLKEKEISQAITSQLRRGVTVVPVTGGYTGSEKKMLLCVVRRNELYRLRTLVHSCDPNAFLMVTEIGEILGEGFTPPKV